MADEARVASGALAPSDPPEVAGLLWEGASGDLAFDVGANQGQSIEIMLDGRFRRVVAFEPAAESLVSLCARFGSDDRVRVVDAAAGPSDGTMELAMRAAPIESGQLVAMNMPYYGELTESEPNMQNWGITLAVREVPSVRLDTAAEKYGVPEFVKIDTEGGETGVLAGAPQLIAGHATRWLVEWHTEVGCLQCAGVFRMCGYDVQVIRNPRYPEQSHMWRNHGWLIAVPRTGEAGHAMP